MLCFKSFHFDSLLVLKKVICIALYAESTKNELEIPQSVDQSKSKSYLPPNPR